ncbi:CapA family protein [Paenibacillus sp. KQZ6P-2]|uniref:CapA family protein n=1 Tax=Paenibacillus mangrovi TaxID=2931978 RepID=A0A9X2B0Y0_9BACL|nr:CapA family protein [Paenibacillus mangrovi]MCJ8010350.1 CapA family protein [Paenibacillus mangrovi]
MYPPRSQKKRSGQKNRKSRQRRLWLTMNASLLLMIVVLLSYYFINDRQSAAGMQSPNPAPAGIEKKENPLQEQGSSAETSSSQDHHSTNAADQPVQKPAKQSVNQPVKEPDKQPAKTDVDAKKQGSNQDGKDQSSNDTHDKSPAGDEGNAAEGSSQKDASVPEEQKSIASDNGKAVTINFVGDMIFSSKVEQVLEKKGYSYPFAYLGDTFKKDDLTLGNLETPVTTGGVSAQNKQYVFKSSPKALDALHAAGMDVVNLGNNHILDQGEVGLLDTIKYLDQSGIQYVGAGKNAARAYEPQYFKRGGMTIAVVGCSRVYPEPSWAAGDNKPGVASVYDGKGYHDRVMTTISNARKKADLVIVMTHWGIERSLTPNAVQTKLAHDFVDAGADLVIGGHPHVLQGLEQYKGKWIAYSTGNFIFTKSSTPSTWKTAVFQATCKPKSGCSMKLTPYHAELGQPVPMNAQEGSQLMKELQGLSIGGVKISSDGVVTPGS